MSDLAREKIQPAPATRAMFGVATCHLTEDDRAPARRLGEDLYHLLTRDSGDPLAFGTGIPVAIGVDVDWNGDNKLEKLADHVLLVIVAGSDSVLLEPAEATARLKQFDCPGITVSKLLVPTDSRWQGEDRRMPQIAIAGAVLNNCLLYTSPSPRDQRGSRMPSSA